MVYDVIGALVRPNGMARLSRMAAVESAESDDRDRSEHTMGLTLRIASGTEWAPKLRRLTSVYGVQAPHRPSASPQGRCRCCGRRSHRRDDDRARTGVACVRCSGGTRGWRLLGLFVSLDRGQLVVRDILRTNRFPVNEVDIRARVVDPRREMYSTGVPDGYPDIPTASDDNTAQTAKWYELMHSKDRYSIDALMGRSPANHERLALGLRQEILAAQGIERAAIRCEERHLMETPGEWQPSWHRS